MSSMKNIICGLINLGIIGVSGYFIYQGIRMINETNELTEEVMNVQNETEMLLQKYAEKTAAIHNCNSGYEGYNCDEDMDRSTELERNKVFPLSDEVEEVVEKSIGNEMVCPDGETPMSVAEAMDTLEEMVDETMVKFTDTLNDAVDKAEESEEDEDDEDEDDLDEGEIPEDIATNAMQKCFSMFQEKSPKEIIVDSLPELGDEESEDESEEDEDDALEDDFDEEETSEELQEDEEEDTEDKSSLTYSMKEMIDNAIGEDKEKKSKPVRGKCVQITLAKDVGRMGDYRPCKSHPQGVELVVIAYWGDGDYNVYKTKNLDEIHHDYTGKEGVMNISFVFTLAKYSETIRVTNDVIRDKSNITSEVVIDNPDTFKMLLATATNKIKEKHQEKEKEAAETEN